MTITSRSLRLLLVSSAIALSLGACNRGEKAEDKAAAVAQDEGPLKYESATPYAKVALTLPEAVRSFPTLYKALYDQEVGALKDYAEGAQADRSEFGGSDFPPYEKIIAYGEPVETGRLFSMIRSDFDYSGGAHPNTVASAVLWDKAENKRLTAEDLFAKDANRAQIERALCDAVNEAKTKRPGAEPVANSGTWTCPALKDLQIALAKGDTDKKASGLTFLLDAYAVGPYVEGAYYITLPYSALSQALNPTYAAEFGGSGKTGDVTNDLRVE